MAQKTGKRYISRQLTNVWKDIRFDPWLYVILLPGLIYVIVFKYMPMYGVRMALYDYNFILGFEGSEFVGFENFVKLFSSNAFMRALKNNIIISILKLAFGFPLTIVLALMINEVRTSRTKKLIQTTVILPNFVSWFIVYGILFAMFNTTSGAIPGFLRSIGYTGTIRNILQVKESFVSLLVISHIWKGMGIGTVIYLAAITGIDPTLYEAAQIDGAGRLRQIWHITISSIRSTIIILLIFRVGEVMDAGFDQVFAMQNSLVISVSDIIDTYIYRVGLVQSKFALGTAAGLFKSMIGLVLVLLTNWFSKKVDPNSGIM